VTTLKPSLALGLAILFFTVLVAPAAAAPVLDVTLSSEQTTLPRSDEGMFYTATVENTASSDPSVGDTLTCQNSTAGWAYVASESDFDYQWLRNGAPIPGETAKNYLITAVDEGQGIQCRVLGSNSTTQAAAAIGLATATAGSNVLTSVVTKHGAFSVGQPVKGNTEGHSTFPIGTTITAVIGESLELSANATFSGDTSISALGPPVATSTVAISLPPAVVNPQPGTLPPGPIGGPVSKPTIEQGDGYFDGEKLTCKAPANWTPGAIYGYQWLRNGAPIPGETSSEYTPVEAEDKTARLQCEVTAQSGSGTPPTGGTTVGVSHSAGWIVVTADPSKGIRVTELSPIAGNGVPAIAFANTTQGSVDLEVELPTGSETFPFSVAGGGWTCTKQRPAGEASARVACTREDPLAPGGSYPPVAIATYLGEDAPDVGTATASVSGGGSPPASAQSQYTFTEGTPFGVLAESFVADVSDQAGADYTKAGGHPFSAHTSFGFNVHRTVRRTPEPTEQVKDVVVDAPRGFVGNALATAEYCPSVKAVTDRTCPDASAVGVIKVFAPPAVILEENPYPNGEHFEVPIYSLEPEFGQPAQFAFAINAGGTFPYTFVPELRPEEGYAISFRTAPIIQIPRLFGTDVTLCGFGAKLTGTGENTKFERCRKPTEAGAFKVPLITNPTRCSGPPPTTRLKIDSWQHPEDVKTADFSAPQITDCEDIAFEPEALLSPTSREADSPTGLDVEITMPIDGVLSNTGISQANLNTAKVTFPKGMTLNPASADGLGACTPGQIQLKTNAEAQCPDSSKVGQIEIDTPLIRETLKGNVYVAAQKDNPFNSTLGLYMVFSSKRDGVTIKVAGKLEKDPKTGQIISTFTENPEAPFSRLALKFTSGPRAPLINPPKCGSYAIRAEFSPWSAVNPANPTPQEIVVQDSKYKVSKGPNGSACPAGNLEPKLRAGLTDPTAGAKSPFVLSLSREDGTQRFTGVSVVNPKGLTAYLKGVATCPESSLRNISSAEGAGRGEIANPSCPANSQVGVAEAGSGAGPLPFYVKTGKVYLAGPYKGAPISLAIVTPAVAGPFDLGNVLVRTPLYVDPVSAQVTAVSDPIPTEVHDIALDVREIRVALNRPGFTAAPTSCEPMSVNAKVSGEGGSTADASVHFQAADCDKLGFKPKLSMRLFGGTKRGAHPRLKATLKARAGDANVAGAAVALPHSVFLEQAHIRTICTRVQFAAKQCPAASIYGHAEAITPLLDSPVSGPVYLRSSSNPLPDLVAALRGPDNQPIEVVLAGRIDSVNSGIRSSFEAVPDQPVSSFTLSMQGGKKGLLVNSRDLCAGKPPRVTARFTGQNGAEANLRPVLKSACGKGRGGKRHGKSGKR
jgi:hypothetical protein